MTTDLLLILWTAVPAVQWTSELPGFMVTKTLQNLFDPRTLAVRGHVSPRQYGKGDLDRGRWRAERA